jgi:hypothetical protein
MVAQNTESQPNPEPKLVKAMPTSPVHAVFDIIELEGKQMVVGSIGFTDQFGMDRMMKTASEKGIINIGSQIMAIFAGQSMITEPNEEDKKKLAEEFGAQVAEGKLKALNAYQQNKS